MAQFAGRCPFRDGCIRLSKRGRAWGVSLILSGDVPPLQKSFPLLSPWHGTAKGHVVINESTVQARRRQMSAQPSGQGGSHEETDVIDQQPWTPPADRREGLRTLPETGPSPWTRPRRLGRGGTTCHGDARGPDRINRAGPPPFAEPYTPRAARRALRPGGATLRFPPDPTNDPISGRRTASSRGIDRTSGRPSGRPPPGRPAPRTDGSPPAR